MLPYTLHSYQKTLEAKGGSPKINPDLFDPIKDRYSDHVLWLINRTSFENYPPSQIFTQDDIEAQEFLQEQVPRLIWGWWWSQYMLLFSNPDSDTIVKVKKWKLVWSSITENSEVLFQGLPDDLWNKPLLTKVNQDRWLWPIAEEYITLSEETKIDIQSNIWNFFLGRSGFRNK